MGQHMSGGPEGTATDAVLFNSEERRIVRYGLKADQLRERFFAKLLLHNAFNEERAYGWAVFNDREVDTNSVIVRRRKVLLAGYMAQNTEFDEEGYAVPTLRIITNEAINAKGRFSILSQDVTLDGNDNARYMISAQLRFSGHQTRSDRPAIFGQALSLAPRFTVRRGELSLYQSFEDDITPLGGVTDSNGVLQPVFPFGCDDTLADHQYAIAMGAEILDSVMAAKPAHIYQPPA
jgi:hypothetical protein